MMHWVHTFDQWWAGEPSWGAVLIALGLWVLFLFMVRSFSAAVSSGWHKERLDLEAESRGEDIIAAAAKLYDQERDGGA